MKKLILTLTLLAGMLLTAQERGPRMRHHKHADLTAEQLATLQTKRLTLALDLTAAQQKKVQKLKLEQEEVRQSRRAEMKEKREADTEKGISAEERYQLELARLDNRIAFKAEMKSILDPAQYEKWERMQHHQKMRSRSKKHAHRSHRRTGR
jgi:hypothetical protein